jgi:hypothetical protein
MAWEYGTVLSPAGGKTVALTAVNGQSPSDKIATLPAIFADHSPAGIEWTWDSGIMP